MIDENDTMKPGRRTVLGLAVLGSMAPLWAAQSHAATSQASNGALAQADLTALERELAAVVSDPALELASLSVLALRAGKPVYAGAFGRRVIGTGAVPDQRATPETLYRIASISKMVTTLGLLRLKEQGLVELDRDVSHYLGFTLRNPAFPAQPITLRHLLLHTSSLRDAGGYFWPATSALKDVIGPAMFSSLAAPGTYYTYCNLGFGIIGTIMERVSGERFDRLMQRLILTPLGIVAGYNPAELPPAAQANLATLYRKRPLDSEQWQPQGPWVAQVDDVATRAPAAPPGLERYVPGTNATPFSPTGGLRISAAGLGTVQQMLINGGSWQGRQILRKATVAEMFARHWQYDGAGGNGNPLGDVLAPRGLGNAHYPNRPGLWLSPGLDLVGHLGDAYGLRSICAFDPVSGDGVVVLCGGSADDPERTFPGQHSAQARYEERVLTALQRYALGRQGA